MNGKAAVAVSYCHSSSTCFTRWFDSNSNRDKDNSTLLPRSITSKFSVAIFEAWGFATIPKAICDTLTVSKPHAITVHLSTFQDIQEARCLFSRVTRDFILICDIQCHPVSTPTREAEGNAHLLTYLYKIQEGRNYFVTIIYLLCGCLPTPSLDRVRHQIASNTRQSLLNARSNWREITWCFGINPSDSKS